MDKKCPKCAESVSQTAKFCPACGEPLVTPPPAEEKAPVRAQDDGVSLNKEHQKEEAAAPAIKLSRAGGKDAAPRKSAGAYIAAAVIVAALLFAALALRSCEPTSATVSEGRTQEPVSQTEPPAPPAPEQPTPDTAPETPDGEPPSAETPLVTQAPPLERDELWALLAGVWVNRDDPSGEPLYIEFAEKDGVYVYGSGVMGTETGARGTATAVRHVYESTYAVDVHYEATEKTESAPARAAYDYTVTLDVTRAAGEEILFAEDQFCTTDFNQYEWFGASMETASFAIFG